MFGLLKSAFGMKSWSATKPTTTGARAAGICRIAGIGDMLLAIHNVFVDLGVKRLAHLAGRARHIDRQPILVNLIDLEFMRA